MSELDTLAPIEQGGLMLVWNVGWISAVCQTHSIFVLDGEPKPKRLLDAMLPEVPR